MSGSGRGDSACGHCRRRVARTRFAPQEHLAGFGDDGGVPAPAVKRAGHAGIQREELTRQALWLKVVQPKLPKFVVSPHPNRAVIYLSGTRAKVLGHRPIGQQLIMT